MISSLSLSSERDISNFVDLASSTLGEDDHAALKTRYLLNALTGYSPLIHDLDTEGTNYESFKEMCEKVWAAMRTNPDLMKSLVRICSKHTLICERYMKLELNDFTQFVDLSNLMMVFNFRKHAVWSWSGWRKWRHTLATWKWNL